MGTAPGVSLSAFISMARDVGAHVLHLAKKKGKILIHGIDGGMVDGLQPVQSEVQLKVKTVPLGRGGRSAAPVSVPIASYKVYRKRV